MSKSRIYELDVLRAFGFLFVVAQHLFGGFARRQGMGIDQSLVLSLLFVVAKPAVPVFLVLVGVTLFLSNKDKVPNFKDFYAKKLKSVIIPYIFWAVIVTVLAGNSAKLSSISSALGTLISGSGDYHLWYMGTLIRIFLFFPFIWFVFNYVYKQGKLARNIFYMLFVVAYSFLNSNNNVIAAAIYLLFDNPSELQKKFVTLSPLFWSLYLVLGIKIAYEYASFVSFLVKRKLYIITSYPFLLAFAFYEEVGAKLGVHESQPVKDILNYPRHILYALFVIVTILVLYIVGASVYKSFPKIYSVLRHIADYSYIGYLIHTSVLTFVVVKTLSYGMSYSLPLEAAIYIVIVALSIEIPHLLSYIPYSYYVLGKKTRFLTLDKFKKLISLKK